MKKNISQILVLIITIFGFFVVASIPEEAVKSANKNAPLEECIKNMSKIQSLIEYYYIQSGSYPKNLEQLDKSYNEPMDKSVEIKEKIAIPKDPATGKDFIYKIDEKNPNNYYLGVPVARLYGVEKIELTALDWGWMKAVAGEEKRRFGVSICVELLKRLATDIEIYANESKGQFPKDLETLVKVKFEVPDALNCPVSKKKYIYELKKDSTYMIKCPEPSVHKMNELQYDSVKGVVGK